MLQMSDNEDPKLLSKIITTEMVVVKGKEAMILYLVHR